MRFALLATAALLSACGASPKAPPPPSSPLQPLAVIFAKVDAGFVAFMKGEAPKQAWAPWPASENFVDNPECRAEMAAHDVVAFRGYGMDFDLIFTLKKGGLAALKLLVVSDGKEVSIGRAELDVDAGYWSGTADPEVYGKIQPELEQCARALFERIRRRHPAPIMESKVFMGRIPPGARAVFERDDPTPVNPADIKVELEKASRLDVEAMKLRLDRCFSFGLDARGAAKGVVALCFEMDHSTNRVGVIPFAFTPFNKSGK